MLGNVIAKVLVLLDYILGYFVVLTPTGTVIGNEECGFACNVTLGSMSGCGQTLIDNVLALTFGIVEVLPDLMCSVFFVY
jgi:hypothetical protein